MSEKMLSALTMSDEPAAAAAAIEAIQADIARMQAAYRTEKHMLAYGSGHDYTQTGHRQGGIPFDRVADLAGKLADGCEPPMLAALRQDIESQQQQLRRLRSRADAVRCWLNALQPVERMVVERHIFHGTPLDMCCEIASREFNVSTTVRSMKRYLNTALHMFETIAA